MFIIENAGLIMCLLEGVEEERKGFVDPEEAAGWPHLGLDPQDLGSERAPGLDCIQRGRASHFDALIDNAI